MWMGRQPAAVGGSGGAWFPDAVLDHAELDRVRAVVHLTRWRQTGLCRRRCGDRPCSGAVGRTSVVRGRRGDRQPTRPHGRRALPLGVLTGSRTRSAPARLGGRGVAALSLSGRSSGRGGHCGDGRPGSAAITTGRRWVDPADARHGRSGSGRARVGLRGQVRRGTRHRLRRTQRPDPVQPQRPRHLPLLPRDRRPRARRGCDRRRRTGRAGRARPPGLRPAATPHARHDTHRGADRTGAGAVRRVRPAAPRGSIAAGAALRPTTRTSGPPRISNGPG